VEPYDNLMPQIIAVQVSDPLAVDVSAELVDGPIAEVTNSKAEENEWKVVTGALTNQERLSIPVVDHLRGKVISLFHDKPQSGHFGALQTTELVSWDFYWPAMDLHVHKDVRGSRVCHRIKPPRHAGHRINMPLETQSRRWEGIMMDFVTDLPESMTPGCTWIVNIVVRLRMMEIYLPCLNDIASAELACLFFEHVIC